ncbi:hypothetical protein KACC15558_06920 [Brevibacterium ammoniilyticum]|uniref:Uncharacterized protein n=2 Tax=Brevibacteriaceae TaxID=85019 RepID=A0ABP9TXW3_9MICO
MPNRCATRGSSRPTTSIPSRVRDRRTAGTPRRAPMTDPEPGAESEPGRDPEREPEPESEPGRDPGSESEPESDSPDGETGTSGSSDEGDDEREKKARLERALRAYRATLRNEAESGTTGFSAEHYRSQKPPHW